MLPTVPFDINAGSAKKATAVGASVGGPVVGACVGVGLVVGMVVGACVANDDATRRASSPPIEPWSEHQKLNRLPWHSFGNDRVNVLLFGDSPKHL